jgi:branched-chain amino acid transport system substrate-binding protein
MSSPTDRPDNPNDYSAYAPKWARDPNREKRHEGPSSAEGEAAQPLTEGELPKASQLRSSFERDRLRMPRSLDVEILREPPPAAPALGRLAALGGLTIAAFAGAAIALLVMAKLPSEWSKMFGINTDKTELGSKTESGSKFAADTLKTPETQSTPASLPLASTEPRAVDQYPARAASARGTGEGTPSIRGVTDKEIRFGISAPFTGSAKELGSQMKLGIETAFNLINEAGGIHGRQLKLVAADDGYEPTRTAETMKQLYETEQVFGFIGNVGTPTAVVGLPYALERKMLFFGAFTGAGLLRRDPPDRYVFNYRASYAEETDAVVRYLVKVRGLRPDQIAVFAQQDAYGDSGFAGVAKAMRTLRGGDERTILRLGYTRNTVDVDDAVARLRAHKIPIKAVVMVPTYRAAAKFVEKTRDLYPTMIYTNVSFVGSTSLADELMLLGPRYANGVIVTQVVPAADSYASAVLKYKTALAKYFPSVPPDYVSLEGYVAGSVLLEGLNRAGPQLDTEKLIEALETVRDFDMGLGTLISFGPTEHQGSHKVWGTQLNENGRYQAIDLQ